MRKKIAVTMGEPGGIGPEVVVKALHDPGIRRHCHVLVIGDEGIIRRAIKKSDLPLRVNKVSDINNIAHSSDVINLVDIKTSCTFRECRSSKTAGRAIVAYIEKAVILSLNHEVHAIVTAPISKESLKKAGYSWPGHTEMLAELTHARTYAMMFVSRKLRIVLSTIHIPLREVPRKITSGLINRTIELAFHGAVMLGIPDPRIAVAGINPHAGESGIMGREEITAIIPAVKRARQTGLNVAGPFPPDVVFHRAYRGEYDIIVCMYHDQGLIPFKMIAFDTGVNMTVGLPIIRTSPGHGTAFDIAWQNKANPSSMIEAIRLAAKLKLRDGK